MTGKIPNSKQLYFFMMPEETTLLFQYILSKSYMIYAPRSNNAKPRVYEVFDNIAQAFYCPKELVCKICMYKISDNLYALDQTTSPVVEIDCSILYEDQLSRGRIYFRSGYAGREGRVSFSEKLYECFNNVLSFMRKEILTKDRKYLAYLSRQSIVYSKAGGCLTQL